MDIAIIGCGLGVLGYLINGQKNKYDYDDIYEKEFKETKDIKIKKYNKSESDKYNSTILRQLHKEYDNEKVDYTKKSMEKDSNVINRVWRILNDDYRNKKINKETDDTINKDLKNLKNIKHNNIENMKNIYNLNSDTDSLESFESYDNKSNNSSSIKNYDDDSVFSDDYSLPLVTNNIPITNNNGKSLFRNENTNNKNIKRNKKRQKNIITNDDVNTYENSSAETFDNVNNVNTAVLNTQDRFFEDIETSLSGEYESYKNNDDDENNENNENNEQNELDRQYGELKFDHVGIPGTLPPDRKMLKPFNQTMKVIPESEFKADCDGRFGVTSDMTHNNMVPFFKSNTYGYNPMREKQMENFAVRNIELFTGSDKNPQFRHKQEVENLFPDETGKVESVTGLPNFSDYFESRYIPSQSRNGELLTQPIRTTPGLNLGYTQNGNTGRQDLYRVMPRTVDQLRTTDNPKVSHEQPIIPGQKGNKGRIMGKMVQQGPDRFYYNSPDSMLPQVGEFEAPAIYGKYIIDPTNREMNGGNDYVGPVKSHVDKNTPEYLQGQFKNPFKKTYEHAGPRNVQKDTRGQIINQESWTPNETKRQTINYGDQYIGNAGHNKTQGYLLNNENAIPEQTNRSMSEPNPIANVKGNKTSVPLINFLNYVPEVTKKQILLEDNGRKNLTNISNSLRGYLFNSINAIPDQTLRSILTEKVILANTKGNSDRGYLFNSQNNITDQNMRNLSENNLILTNLSNSEKGYLFNYINNIPDTNLRNILNTLYSSGGLNIKGNHEQSYLLDYKNAIPDTTMRELTENIVNLTNVKGSFTRGYLIDYINSIPDTTMKQLTENNLFLGTVSPLQMKGYLMNYVNSIPDTTMKELTENNDQLNNIKGNFTQNYVFNYENNIPEQTLRNLIENISNIANFKGNHNGDYLINYIDSIPDSTLKELTENNTNLTNISPLKMKTYLINYINSIPDPTLREMTENQQNIIGQKGNRSKSLAFNYDNGIPDPTIRSQTENQKIMTGQKGNKSKSIAFNYDNGIPDPTNRNQTENQKNITGFKSTILGKEYMFNYDNGIPDPTNRNQTENQKNITGQKGEGTQSRTRLDYSNALLNVEKEVIAQGRTPVPVKGNVGKTTLFTQYAFNDDTISERPMISSFKQAGNIENELYSFQ